MRKLLKVIIKVIAILIALPLVYILISLIFTVIPISEKESIGPKTHTIYLTTNGVHADLVLPKKLIAPEILNGQVMHPADAYFAFGWGEENFYINTPTWADLKFSVAFRAAFLESKTLMHVTRYRTARSNWISVKITDDQLKKLNAYILNTFDRSTGTTQLVQGATYTADRDNFYRAHGNYMFYRTCNSWLNAGLKKSGMKGSLWTPFDFGVLRWYE
ncbi:DUF2459 domain-containing protein [Dokdonia sinensis]|uniref:DUF2459 domain-containing protein n=1 Tax=Dokdonia sinensis TaxID=2479847 RepID=A0A3M0G6Q8_9FLAO|nr:DUF2459 domain-containing protein [Dokdonia sinensis]RMB58012.1 DUF2459 domain-containing protein [Dokdonia sinensis]